MGKPYSEDLRHGVVQHGLLSSLHTRCRPSREWERGSPVTSTGDSGQSPTPQSDQIFGRE